MEILWQKTNFEAQLEILEKIVSLSVHNSIESNNNVCYVTDLIYYVKSSVINGI